MAVNNLAGSPGVSRDIIRRAQKAVDNIDTMKTWKDVITAVKWVMDTVSQIAEVCTVSLFVNSSSNSRRSAEPVRKTGMEHALKDPRGPSRLLFPEHGSFHLFLFTMSPGFATASSARR
jgi:hypothetical protein